MPFSCLSQKNLSAGGRAYFHIQPVVRAVVAALLHAEPLRRRIFFFDAEVLLKELFIIVCITDNQYHEPTRLAPR